jgi:hypothetical protein
MLAFATSDLKTAENNNNIGNENLYDMLGLWHVVLADYLGVERPPVEPPPSGPETPHNDDPDLMFDEHGNLVINREKFRLEFDKIWENLLENNSYTSGTWNEFMLANQEFLALLDDPDANVDDLRAALHNLIVKCEELDIVTGHPTKGIDPLIIGACVGGGILVVAAASLVAIFTVRKKKHLK